MFKADFQKLKMLWGLGRPISCLEPQHIRAILDPNIPTYSFLRTEMSLDLLDFLAFGITRESLELFRQIDGSYINIILK